MIMFKEGDFVRRITDDGSGEVVVVAEDELSGANIIHIIGVSGDGVRTWVDAKDFEMVSDYVKAQKIAPTKSIVVHNDVQNMMLQLARYYQESGVKHPLIMELTARVYDNDTTLALECTAKLGYETEITTHDLNKSVEIAIQRAKENEALKPIEIPLGDE
jgi:hypothetical protein